MPQGALRGEASEMQENYKNPKQRKKLLKSMMLTSLSMKNVMRSRRRGMNGDLSLPLPEPENESLSAQRLDHRGAGQQPKRSN